MEDTLSDITQPLLKAVLHEMANWGGTVRKTQSDNVTDRFRQRVKDHQCKDDLSQPGYFGEEAKAVVQKSVTNKFLNLAEGTLDDILCTSYHKAQSCTWSVIDNPVEQVMLNLLRKDVIAQTVSSHIARFFGAEAGSDCVSKKSSTSRWPMA